MSASYEETIDAVKLSDDVNPNMKDTLLSTPAEDIQGTPVSPPSKPESPFEKRTPPKHRKAMFIYLIIIQILLNYDSGAIPPSVVGHTCRRGRECDEKFLGRGIKAEFNLSEFEVGLLGSLVYLGLTLGCVFAGPLLQLLPASRTLGVLLTLNTLFCLLFAASHHQWSLFLSRFCVGVTQAFPVIFAPVWVDEFAPSQSCTTWMSLIQAGVPLGIMGGYAVAGFLAANTMLSWRASFYIQTLLLTPLSIGWFFVPPHYIEPHKTPKVTGVSSITLQVTSSLTSDLVEATTGRKKNKSNRKQQAKAAGKMLLGHVKHLLTNTIYLADCNALCALYFCVTGIQLWITSYLRAPPISRDMNSIVVAFTATSATAPILGVLFGGKLVDKLGGYQESMHSAAKLATVFGACAVACALPSMFTHRFWLIIFLVWLLLFFGGAVVPAATGILITVVDRDARPVASGFSMLLYNLLGYFAGPFLSGLVASLAHDHKWSYRLVMMWSNISLISMLVVWRLAVKRHKALNEQNTIIQLLDEEVPAI